MTPTPPLLPPHAIDPLIHERVRLGLMSALLGAGEPLTFTQLKDLLDVTDGNLSVHARHLLDAGYLRERKTFVRRRPQTTYAVTAAGRRAFEHYVAAMRALLDAERPARGGRRR